jgi:hypothetical protein
MVVLNEETVFFCDVEADLLHIVYMNFRLQKVKVQITDKITSEETDVELL